MPDSVKGLLEIYEDIVQFLLMLDIFFKAASKVKELFCCSVVLPPALDAACFPAIISSA